MDKYIKLEDAIRVIAGQYMFEATMDSPYASEDIKDYIELGEKLFKDLPTIEVSEDAIEIDNIPSVVADRPKEINYTFDYCPRCGMRFLIPTITEPKGED